MIVFRPAAMAAVEAVAGRQRCEGLLMELHPMWWDCVVPSREVVYEAKAQLCLGLTLEGMNYCEEGNVVLDRC